MNHFNLYHSKGWDAYINEFAPSLSANLDEGIEAGVLSFFCFELL
jgi:hypothetical protein